MVREIVHAVWEKVTEERETQAHMDSLNHIAKKKHSTVEWSMAAESADRPGFFPSMSRAPCRVPSKQWYYFSLPTGFSLELEDCTYATQKKKAAYWALWCSFVSLCMLRIRRGCSMRRGGAGRMTGWREKGVRCRIWPVKGLRKWSRDIFGYIHFEP